MSQRQLDRTCAATCSKVYDHRRTTFYFNIAMQQMLRLIVGTA
jgi:hypothetical protein